MSYRLRAAGYRLVLCRDARSLHHWRERAAAAIWCSSTASATAGSIWSRDTAALHRRRGLAGRMMLHPVLLLAAACTVGCRRPGRSSARGLARRGADRVGPRVRTADRGMPCRASVTATRPRWRSRFSILARDAAWVDRPSSSGACAGSSRCRRGRRSACIPRPADSGDRGARASRSTDDPAAFLVLIPAHNEAASLPSVVRELQAIVPDRRVAGRRRRIDRRDMAAWRLAGRSLAATARTHGRRRRGSRRPALRGEAWLQRSSSASTATASIIRKRSSRWSRRSSPTARTSSSDRALRRATGRRAGAGATAAGAMPDAADRPVGDRSDVRLLRVRRRGPIEMLCEHHPTGYAEAELLLFSSRNGLRAEEVPVRRP